MAKTQCVHSKMPLQLTYKNPYSTTSKRPENAVIFQPLFTGKEKDSETGYYYFGARYYNSDLSLWLSVDPMAEKYPSLSPYNYCAWNPMKLVDPNGEEEELAPYIIFNGEKHSFQIWDDNNTPDDYDDDLLLAQFHAGNNVSRKDNPSGNWEDGIYSMLDTEKPYKHYDNNGNPLTEVRKGSIIPKDSKDGAYGEYGIFRANNFSQDDGTVRSGMAFHAGRGVTDESSQYSYTMGCIRVAPEAILSTIDAINEFGPLQKIVVQNNRQSTKSPEANSIRPGGNLPIYLLKPIKIEANR